MRVAWNILNHSYQHGVLVKKMGNMDSEVEGVVRMDHKLLPNGSIMRKASILIENEDYMYIRSLTNEISQDILFAHILLPDAIFRADTILNISHLADQNNANANALRSYYESILIRAYLSMEKLTDGNTLGDHLHNPELVSLDDSVNPYSEPFLESSVYEYSCQNIKCDNKLVLSYKKMKKNGGLCDACNIIQLREKKKEKARQK